MLNVSHVILFLLSSPFLGNGNIVGKVNDRIIIDSSVTVVLEKGGKVIYSFKGSRSVILARISVVFTPVFSWIWGVVSRNQQNGFSASGGAINATVHINSGSNFVQADFMLEPRLNRAEITYIFNVLMNGNVYFNPRKISEGDITFELKETTPGIVTSFSNIQEINGNISFSIHYQPILKFPSFDKVILSYNQTGITRALTFVSQATFGPSNCNKAQGMLTYEGATDGSTSFIACIGKILGSNSYITVAKSVDHKKTLSILSLPAIISYQISDLNFTLFEGLLDIETTDPVRISGTIGPETDAINYTISVDSFDGEDNIPDGNVFVALLPNSNGSVFIVLFYPSMNGSENVRLAVVFEVTVSDTLSGDGSILDGLIEHVTDNSGSLIYSLVILNETMDIGK